MKQWADKARDNLEAALYLLPSDDGREDSFPNASVSRAYYAAYLAVATSAQAGGYSFTGESRRGGEPYYRHDSIAEDVLDWDLVDEDTASDLDWLRGLRIKADYLEDNLNLEEASAAADVAARILDLLLPGARP